MECRDYPGGHIVDPDPCAGSLVGICGEESWLMVGIGLLEVFEDDGRFVEWLRASAVGRAGERWNEAARVQSEERLRFVVGVDFDVLVGDLLLF